MCISHQQDPVQPFLPGEAGLGENDLPKASFWDANGLKPTHWAMHTSSARPGSDSKAAARVLLPSQFSSYLMPLPDSL